jgi:hypothetical protein
MFSCTRDGFPEGVCCLKGKLKVRRCFGTSTLGRELPRTRMEVLRLDDADRGGLAEEFTAIVKSSHMDDRRCRQNEKLPRVRTQSYEPASGVTIGPRSNIHLGAIELASE